MTTPTTIVELRTSLLQVPWRGAAPAAGILSEPHREIFVLEIETQGGLVGMLGAAGLNAVLFHHEALGHIRGDGA